MSETPDVKAALAILYELRGSLSATNKNVKDAINEPDGVVTVFDDYEKRISKAIKCLEGP